MSPLLGGKTGYANRHDFVFAEPVTAIRTNTWENWLVQFYALNVLHCQKILLQR